MFHYNETLNCHVDTRVDTKCQRVAFMMPGDRARGVGVSRFIGAGSFYGGEAELHTVP